MEAHRSYERFEQGHEVSTGEDGTGGAHHGRNAALVVAVMAAFLAIATFLSNEAVKEVVTGETQRADTSAQLESNRVKIEVADGGAVLLRTLGQGSPAQALADAAAERHQAHIVGQLKPTDERLLGEIHADEDTTDHANEQHIVYELAEVGLEIGIVLASVSIIARRRWLLGVGGAVATAGVVLLVIGLLL